MPQNIEVELYRALKLLSASNRTLLRATNESAILYDVCKIATEIGGYCLSWVGFKEMDRALSVRPVAHCGYEEGFLDASKMSWADCERGHSAMSTAIRTGKTQLRFDILNDPQLAPWHDDARSRNYKSAIALPLQVDEKVIGAIAIYAPEPHAFCNEEVELLEELACDLSFGIQTIRLRADHEQANARIHRLAFFDSLTSLPNRNHLSVLLPEAIAAAKRDNSQFSLLLLNLDIQEINETYGHSAGDNILLQVSKRVRELVEENCIITRFGGNDFIIICENCSHVTAVNLAKHILSSIKQPFLLDARSFAIDCKIGIVLYPLHAENQSELLSRVDLAMSKVKKAGCGYRFYNNEMTRELTRKLDLIQRLKSAALEGNLQLYYQPKVELYAGMIVGAEALLRWHDPMLGNITPSEFIPIAEERGMMPEMGEWVLKTACLHIRQWQEMGLACHGKIAVNVSGKQLEDPYFLERVRRVIEQTGISPALIELELTESCLMEDPTLMLEILTQLRWMGFSIAIDDFGTGYSSLAYLKKFPIDTLKIDQSFVKNMLEDRNDRAIISTILAIAEHMGLLTVAEGIENEEQRQALKELGCVLAQGYYFSKPQPMIDFTEKLLKSHCPITPPGYR